MKKILAFAIAGTALILANSAQAQDKSKRPSQPDSVTQTINTGATITINYSQPLLKGRTIGKDVEPMVGKVWRMGANEATTFEVDKDVTIEGKKLPAGKYSLFGLQGEKDYTLIFNKEWKIWGTQYDQNKEKDALRVPATQEFHQPMTEKLTYTITKEGHVRMNWGTMSVEFHVQ
jgi:hypothetical protein